MYTSDTDKLEFLYEDLRKSFPEETVAVVRDTIQVDPINAQGCAITKEGYLTVWKQLDVMDAIDEISKTHGIHWTHTPVCD